METQERKSLPSTLYTEEYFLTACEGYDVFLESEVDFDSSDGADSVRTKIGFEIPFNLISND